MAAYFQISANKEIKTVEAGIDIYTTEEGEGVGAGEETEAEEGPDGPE